jgi:hypothetical protein
MQNSYKQARETLGTINMGMFEETIYAQPATAK